MSDDVPQDLPTVRAVVDFTPNEHLLFNLNDEQARTLYDRFSEAEESDRTDTAADGTVARRPLTFSFSPAQVAQTNAAFEELATTGAADAALVDLTATDPDAAPPSMTLMLSMATPTREQLASGFADAADGETGGQWSVEIPGLAMDLVLRAFELAFDGDPTPTETAMALLGEEQ